MNEDPCSKCDELATALEHLVIILRILQPQSSDRGSRRYQESLSALEACLRGYHQQDD